MTERLNKWLRGHPSRGYDVVLQRSLYAPRGGRYEYDVGPSMAYGYPRSTKTTSLLCFQRVGKKHGRKRWKSESSTYISSLRQTRERSKPSTTKIRRSVMLGTYRSRLAGRSNLSVPSAFLIISLDEGDGSPRRAGASGVFLAWQSVKFKLQIGLMKSSPLNFHLAISPTSAHSLSRVP